jgi:uncharacterized OB-fold protein
LTESRGLGHVYSWVVVNRTLSPEFADDTPYVIVAVDLDEGARMVGRLLERADAPIQPGEAVCAVLYTALEQTLVGFRRPAS